MKNILAKAVAALVILASSVYANASIITLNGSQEVNALKINESFESFYNFTNWSANTGFEKANELVAFFALDDMDNLGLYMIFGGPSGQPLLARVTSPSCTRFAPSSLHLLGLE